MSAAAGIETEIKLLAPADPAAARALLERHGFVEFVPRMLEINSVFDTPDSAIRGRGELLRLRLAGDQSRLTWKGKSARQGPHKSRPEHEVSVGDYATMDTILRSLGYQVTFRYDKYRTEFHEQAHPQSGIATLDETPIGVFYELEGPPDWIDATAARLGFTGGDYITASYAALYFDWCRTNQRSPGFMTFEPAE